MIMPKHESLGGAKSRDPTEQALAEASPAEAGCRFCPPTGASSAVFSTSHVKPRLTMVVVLGMITKSQVSLSCVQYILSTGIHCTVKLKDLRFRRKTVFSTAHTGKKPILKFDLVLCSDFYNIFRTRNSIFNRLNFRRRSFESKYKVSRVRNQNKLKPALGRL